MNASQVLDHFDRICDAPDAIPRLRQFILDLAVRGKLVEQDPTDEPSELVKHLLAKHPPTGLGSSRVAPQEASFEIPVSWSWVSLGYAAHVEMGQSPPSEHYNQSRQGLPFYQGKTDFGVKHPTPRYWCSQPTKLALKDDILISVRAPVGPTNVADENCCIGRGLAALRVNKGVDRDFLLLTLKGFEGALADLGFGTTFVAINKKQLISFPIPLPPLAEQHRIVAKVDELMALCDRLEAAQTERETRRDKLAAASLYRLNNGADGDEFREHARFHLRHLPRLTTRPEHIHQLRQTILNLAVRGKLVPQDPHDEPASELIERIRVEKVQMVRDGKLKTVEAISPIEGELPHQLPFGWAFARLQSLCISVVDGDHLPPPKTSKGVPFLVIGNVRNKSIEFEGCRHVSEEYFNALDSIRRPQTGDVLYTLVGSFGIPITVGDSRPFCVQRHIGILRPSKLLDVCYLSRALESQFVLDQAAACATGIAQKTVPLSGLRRMLIPLAPLAEQHRIVAKVGELMALCDRLKAQLSTTHSESRRLLEAVLHEALSGGR